MFAHKKYVHFLKISNTFEKYIVFLHFLHGIVDGTMVPLKI